MDIIGGSLRSNIQIVREILIASRKLHFVGNPFTTTNGLYTVSVIAVIAEVCSAIAAIINNRKSPRFLCKPLGVLAKTA